MNQGALRLQLVGIAGDSAQLVVRGDAARFSVLCLRDGRLTAVEL